MCCEGEISMDCVRRCFFRVHGSVFVLALMTSAGMRTCAQSGSTQLTFEAATIKPVAIDASHPFDPKHYGAHVYQSRARYWSMTLRDLIEYAYDIHSFQVSGSGSSGSDRFDIEAIFPEGAAKQDERRMLQALLKDRFKLAFHIESKDLEGYALVVGKHGSQLKPSLPDPSKSEMDTPSISGEDRADQSPAKPRVTANPDGSSTIDLGKRGTQTVKFDPENWLRHYQRSKMAMAELAEMLSDCVGREGHKVEDRTGIQGDYQVSFDCPLGMPRPMTGSDASDMLPSDPEGGWGGALNHSLDTLGLKLEKCKVPVEVYVIDHTEKPSEN